MDDLESPRKQRPHPAMNMTNLLATSLLSYSLFACQDNLTHPVGPTPYEPETPLPLTCVPNLDGEIDSDELAPTLGVSATFIINPVDAPRTFDPAGEVDASGKRLWDLSLPDTDPVIEVTARALADTWYAADFPGDAFVAPLDAGHTLEGIYRHDGAGLSILGIASIAASPPEGQTLWRYDAPVLLYRFPLTVGARWTSVGEVRDGLVRGLPYAGRDTYTFEVLDAGGLVLPDMTFSQVLRVRSTLVSQPAVGQSQTRHQVSWLFECFGEVARATSAPNEPDPNFTRAAELRRLGL